MFCGRPPDRGLLRGITDRRPACRSRLCFKDCNHGLLQRDAALHGQCRVQVRCQCFLHAGNHCSDYFPHTHNLEDQEQSPGPCRIFRRNCCPGVPVYCYWNLNGPSNGSTANTGSDTTRRGAGNRKAGKALNPVRREIEGPKNGPVPGICGDGDPVARATVHSPIGSWDIGMMGDKGLSWADSRYGGARTLPD